eukprot:COSAG02_NODE_886_length_16174_cov_15.983765_2_plen_173_part_00
MLRKFSCEMVDASSRVMLTTSKHQNDGNIFRDDYPGVAFVGFLRRFSVNSLSSNVHVIQFVPALHFTILVASPTWHSRSYRGKPPFDSTHRSCASPISRTMFVMHSAQHRICIKFLREAGKIRVNSAGLIDGKKRRYSTCTGRSDELATRPPPNDAQNRKVGRTVGTRCTSM